MYVCMCVCMRFYIYVCIPLKTNKKDYQEWSYGDSNNIKKFFF